jgi:hypothetical protein
LAGGGQHGVARVLPPHGTFSIFPFSSMLIRVVGHGYV